MLMLQREQKKGRVLTPLNASPKQGLCGVRALGNKP